MGMAINRKVRAAAFRPAWRWMAVVTAALTGLSVAACSGGTHVSEPTMTQQHATARAQQILRETAVAITPRPTLEINPLLSGTGPCLAESSDSSKQVQVALSYWLRGIPPQDNVNIGQQILHYWKHKGYAITSTKGVGTGSPTIAGGTVSDDFLISLQTSSNGAMFIGTTSPCIWPHGTPPPS